LSNNDSNSGFLRNVATLVTGTLIAQVISVLSMYFLLKYFFSPSNHSQASWIYNLIMVFASISSLRLETAIVLEHNEKKEHFLIQFCLKLIAVFAVVGLLFATILFFVNDSANQFLSNWNIILIPIGIFVFGVVQLLNQYHVHKENYKLLSGNKIIQSLTRTGSQLGFGAIGINSIGLVLGQIVGGLAALIPLALRTPFKKIRNSILDNQERKETLQKHKKFILFTTPATLLGKLIEFVFIHQFITYFNPDMAGNLTASFTLIGMVILVVAGSFSQVYYKNISKINNAQELLRDYIFWVKRLSILSTLGLILVWLLPNELGNTILGPEWIYLIPVVKVMSVWMSVMFISSSLSYIFIKINKQEVNIILDLVHLILVSASIYFSYSWYQDFETSLWWFSVTQTIFYAAVILISLTLIKQYQPENS